MPTGDIPGWHEIYTDDFTTDVPLGSYCGDPNGFPGADSGKWTAYPWPWTGTPTWANYCPQRVTSIHDGVMDMWLHSETINGSDYHLITANEPEVNGAGNPLYLPAGRYVIRFKSDDFQGYHASWLLWPQADDTGTQPWPGSGEIDFPEADYDSSSISGFVHYQDATSGGDQAACSASTPMYGAWHTAVIEWSSGAYVRFYLDGQELCNVTSRVPVSPMRLVIQNGGWWGSTATDAMQGHVYVDWVAVYVPS